MSALMASHNQIAGDAECAARFAKDTLAYQDATESLCHALTLLQALPDSVARRTAQNWEIPYIRKMKSHAFCLGLCDC